MASKSRKTTPPRSKPTKVRRNKPAATPEQNAWLSGLGALAEAQANAQAEGSKAFEALVQQGLDMQARTQAAAKKQWDETTEKMSALSAQIAANPWDRLSDIFQGRVARALEHMGMPTVAQLAELSERVDALEKAVQRLGAPAVKPAAIKASARGTTPKAKSRKG